MIVDELKTSVRYSETDRMQRIYYSKYLEYFELGRVSLLKNFAIPYNEIENSLGYYMPTKEVYVNFIKAADFGDNLLVKTKIVEKPLTKIKFNYEIFRGCEQITVGYTINVFIRGLNGKIARPPKILQEVFRKYFD
jgi:acyl-CoA thioester hydrolase